MPFVVCGYCDRKNEYPYGSHWGDVLKIVNDHYTVCPRSLRSALSDLPPTRSWVAFQKIPENTSATAIGGHTRRSSSEPRRKNVTDEDERRRLLEQDVWATEVHPKSVKCKACLNTISLDKRFRYYRGLWDKHREKCPSIKLLEAKERSKQLQGASRLVILGEASSSNSTSTYLTSAPTFSEVRHDKLLEDERKKQNQTYSSGVVHSHSRYDADSPPATVHHQYESSADERYQNHVNSDPMTSQNNPGIRRRSGESTSKLVNYHYGSDHEPDEKGERSIRLGTPFSSPGQDVKGYYLEIDPSAPYRPSTYGELRTNFRESARRLIDKTRDPEENSA